jgi:hypothetical protein
MCAEIHGRGQLTRNDADMRVACLATLALQASISEGEGPLCRRADMLPAAVEAKLFRFLGTR